MKPQNLDFDKHSTRNPCFSKFTVSYIFSICIDFGGHVGLQNPFKIHQKSIKNLSKKSLTYDTFLSIFNRFWPHLGPQVEAMLGLCWPKNPFEGLFKKSLKHSSKKVCRMSRRKTGGTSCWPLITNTNHCQGEDNRG